jgi:AAA15 family ATPase/GTPase
VTLEAIRLHNFMAFADTGWIELKPISLLFGKNSSGKSAIIRSLLLLRQSVEASDKTGKPLVFFSRDGIDSGSFVETVHKHDPNRAMVFRFRCRFNDLLQYLPKDENGKTALDKLRKKINERREQHGKAPIKPDDPLNWLEVSLSFRWIEEKNKDSAERKTADPAAIRLDAPWAWLEGQERVTIFGLEKLLDQEAIGATGREWWLWSDVLTNPEKAWPPLNLKSSERGFWPAITDPKLFLNHPDLEDFEFVSDLLEATRQVVTDFLTSFKYLGPLRPEPERLYAKNKLAVIEWQQRGWGAFVDFLRYEADQSKFEEIDHWLVQLGLGEKINPPEAAQNTSKELAIFGKVTLEEKKGSEPINLKDVGFGTAQVLPVVIQTVLAPKDTLVIIEQPELHLHPSAQAVLADLFIQKSREGVRFLVETHGESLFLRFRRRLAETSGKVSQAEQFYLEQENFKAHFVDRSEGESNLDLLQFDQWGDYTHRPIRFGDFFGQDFEELVKMKQARGN